MTVTAPSTNLMLSDAVEYVIETGADPTKIAEFYLEDGSGNRLDLDIPVAYSDTDVKVYANDILNRVYEPVIPDLTITVPTSAASWYKKSHRLKYREIVLDNCEQTEGAYSNTAAVNTYMGFKNPALDWRDLTNWRTNKPNMVYLPRECDDFLLIVSASPITISFEFLLVNGTTTTLTSAPITGEFLIPCGPNNFFVPDPGAYISYKVTAAGQSVIYVPQGCTNTEFIEVLFQEPAGCWSCIPIVQGGVSVGASGDSVKLFSGPAPGLTDAQRFNKGDLAQMRYAYKTLSITTILPNTPGSYDYYGSLFTTNRAAVVKKNAAGSRVVHRMVVEGGGVSVTERGVELSIQGKVAYPIQMHTA